MKWTKVDQYTNQPVARNSGWHIVDYISGDYRIVSDNGKWILRKSDELIAVFKTLKEAKAYAENKDI